MSYVRVLKVQHALTGKLCKVFNIDNLVRPKFNAAFYKVTIPWHKYSSIMKKLMIYNLNSNRERQIS